MVSTISCDLTEFDIWTKYFVTYQPDNCDWLNIWSLYRLLSGADILDLIELIDLIINSLKSRIESHY